MSSYQVGHIWIAPHGDPYLRFLNGAVDHIDLAFYLVDLLSTEAQVTATVYLYDPGTGTLTAQQRPAAPTLPPEAFPTMRVCSGEDGGPSVYVATGGVGVASTPTE